MNCMKCGKDTVEGQAFCPECQKEMARHPVNPNTPVILPKRVQTASPKKVSRKKAIPPEEQVLLLKKRVRTLSILLVSLFLLGSGLIYGIFQYYQRILPAPGQNYTSIVSKSTTVSTTEGD